MQTYKENADVLTNLCKLCILYTYSSNLMNSEYSFWYLYGSIKKKKPAGDIGNMNERQDTAKRKRQKITDNKSEITERSGRYDKAEKDVREQAEKQRVRGRGIFGDRFDVADDGRHDAFGYNIYGDRLG